MRIGLPARSGRHYEPVIRVAVRLKMRRVLKQRHARVVLLHGCRPILPFSTMQ